MFQASFFPSSGFLIIHPPDHPVKSDDVFEHELLFVWGELMNPHFVREIIGRFIPFAIAVLEDFTRKTEKIGDHYSFSLIPQTGSLMQGVILIGLTDEDFDALDRFERCPVHMIRKKVEIKVGDMPRIAQMYFPAE
jgi:hypothetical protein